MASPVRILGPNGQPLPPHRGRASMLSGAGGSPYDAADMYGDHMADWTPFLGSPDGDLNMHRDRIVSRVRDMVRSARVRSAIKTRTDALGAVEATSAEKFLNRHLHTKCHQVTKPCS